MVIPRGEHAWGSGVGRRVSQGGRRAESRIETRADGRGSSVDP